MTYTFISSKIVMNVGDMAPGYAYTKRWNISLKPTASLL